MPKLPSGLHIAADAGSLRKIVEEAQDGIRVAPLLSIDTIPQLFHYIDVIFFRSRTGKTPGNYLHDIPPDDLEPYPSGYTLGTIHNLAKNWTEEDQAALDAFVGQMVEEKYFDELLAYVQRLKKEMEAQPRTIAGMQAIWWKLGCHPFQEEQQQAQERAEARKKPNADPY